MNDGITWQDRVEIHDLLARVAMTADTADDIDDYLDLMTDDIVFEFAANAAVGLSAASYSGRDEVGRGAVSRREQGIQGPGSRSLHVISSITIDPGAAGTASAMASWRFYAVRDDAPALVSIGIYANEFRRESGRWLLSRRAVTVY